MSIKFARSTSLLQTKDLIFLGDLAKLIRRMQSLKILTILRKEVAEKNAEFENNDNLKKLKKISVSHKFVQSTSLLQIRGLIFLSDMEKVDEKNSEFENCNNLNKGLNPSVDERPSLLLQTWMKVLRRLKS